LILIRSIRTVLYVTTLQSTADGLATFSCPQSKTSNATSRTFSAP
jgi:hypothetical protein